MQKVAHLTCFLNKSSYTMQQVTSTKYWILNWIEYRSALLVYKVCIWLFLGPAIQELSNNRQQEALELLWEVKKCGQLIQVQSTKHDMYEHLYRGMRLYNRFHISLTWGSRGDFLPLRLWGMTFIASGQAWGSRERGQQCSVRRCLETIRDQTWVTRPLRTHHQPTVSAHLHPALALQLGWGSKLQVG